MNSSEIKRLVSQFRREFKITNVTSESLEEVFRKQGFTVVDYNPVVNDEDVTTVIESLGLEEMIRHTNGFLYVDSRYRLVFINEKLSIDERKVVLAHEEGHYYCGHTDKKARSVAEEHEANEFAHYLLKRSARRKVRDTLSNHWMLALLVVGAIAALLIGVAIYKTYREQQLYAGEYYVTMHGEKYHVRNCVTTEGHPVRRLKKEEFDDYEPCSVCIPEG